MIPNPSPIQIPTSYESLNTAHIKVSHHPAGAPTATPVVIVTLNRPDMHNAFTGQMMQDFERVYPMFDADDRVKVVVLTGAGKTFCAGADLEIGFQRDTAERTMDHRDRYVCLSNWIYVGSGGLTFSAAVEYLSPFTSVASRLSSRCRVLPSAWA